MKPEPSSEERLMAAITHAPWSLATGTRRRRASADLLGWRDVDGHPAGRDGALGMAGALGRAEMLAG